LLFGFITYYLHRRVRGRHLVKLQAIASYVLNLR
jgi:hypothetical protein